eukprot:971212_1
MKIHHVMTMYSSYVMIMPHRSLRVVRYHIPILCKTHADAINNIICNHFELDDPDRFTVKILDDLLDDLDLNTRDSMQNQMRLNTSVNPPLHTAETEDKEDEELLQDSEGTVEMILTDANQMDLELTEKIQLILRETQTSQIQLQKQMEQRIYQLLNTKQSDDERAAITDANV